MELALLIIFNIFMGAVFYLIISLKLERSASEFREKRLRKVMDDIIQEFNATAERNITILENRIMVMKKLLERSGDFSSVNVELSDDNSIEKDQQEPLPRLEEIPLPEKREVEIIGVSRSAGSRFHMLAHLFSGARDVAADLLRRGYQYIANARERRKIHSVVSSDDMRSGAASDMNILDESSDILLKEPLIERDYSEIEEKLSGGSHLPEQEMDEKELSDLFSSTDDRYSLVTDLYERGYTVDLISKCSGIPIGEIKLVLNLSNP